MISLDLRGVAAAPIAAVTLAAVVGGGAAPLIAVSLENAGVSEGWIGFNAALGAAALLFFGAASAPLLRRLGMRLFLALCLAGLAIGLLAFKLSDGFFWACLWRFVIGAGMAGLFVGSEFWILSAAPAGRKGIAVAAYTLVLATGLAAGPAVLLLTGVEGWPPFLAFLGVTVLAGAPLLMGGAPPPEPPRPTIEAGSQAAGPREGGAFAFARTAPHLFWAAVLFGLLETGAGAMLPVWGLALGLEQAAAVGLVAAFAIGGMVFQPLFAWLADRRAPEGLLLLAGCCCLLGALLAPLAASAGVWTLFALVFFWGGPSAGLYIAALVSVGRALAGDRLAAANAALVSGYGLGALLGPLGIGAGMEWLGPAGLPVAIGVAAAAYLPLAIANLSPRGARRA